MSSSHDPGWALVLGASSGMGRATALAWARQGGDVLGVHFDTGSQEAAVAELVAELRGLGREAHFFNVNAASERTRAELVPQFAELTGEAGLAVVLHSLAFGSLAPFLGNGSAQITQRQMDMTLNVMAHSLVYWVQDLHAAGMLREGAKVFAMTSAGDQKVSANYGAVSAAKCALEAHVRQLAFELAPFGVSVNALRAGVTPTPSLVRIPEHEVLLERALRANPHDRLTRPEDTADAIVLLAGARSSWLTGNVIGIDGGELLAT